MKQEPTYMYGRHAVNQALEQRPEIISELLMLKGVTLTKQAEANMNRHKVVKKSLDPNHLPREITDADVHQGMIALVDPSKLVVDFDSFIASLEITPQTCLVLLGELQDPQNVGSIIRSAAAMGIAAVLLPEHNQAPINATVIKVSAGMAFTVPLVQIGNINYTIKSLQEKGFWVYGLDGESKERIDTQVFDAPTVFVVGNEGEGIRPKTKEACDVLVSIPMDPRCESLNASVSTAMAMYEWKRGQA